jgi:hypothetical protein
MKPYSTLKEDLIRISEASAARDDAAAPGRNVLARLTYGEDHEFPDSEALVSLLGGLEVDLYHALALVLKAEWEETYACSCKSWVPRSGHPLMPIFTEVHERNVRAADFNPDTQSLFSVVSARGYLAGQQAYRMADFDTLIQQMILSELHLARNDGPEVTTFAAAERARLAMLGEADPEEQQAFWSARCRWTQVQESLDELHVQIENRRLRNAETRRAYLALFGKDEIALQEAIYRQCDLNRRKLLLDANPELTADQLDDLVDAEEERHRKELDDLIFCVTMAPALEKRVLVGGKLDFDAMREYKARAKRLLRELRMKIHPDHLQNDPAYRKLTDRQRKELDALLHAAIDVNLDELGVPPGFIEHDMRSVAALEAALAKVDALLRNAGIDTRIEMVIQGETLRDQLAWLQEACKSIDRRIETARTELHALATDPDAGRMQAVLDSPDQHEQIRQELRKTAREYRDTSELLQADIVRLFDRQKSEAA